MYVYLSMIDVFVHHRPTDGRSTLLSLSDVLTCRVDRFRLRNLTDPIICSHEVQRIVIVVKTCIVHMYILWPSHLHGLIVLVGSLHSSRFLLNCSSGTGTIWFIVNVGCNFAHTTLLCWSQPMVVLLRSCLHTTSGIAVSWCRGSIFGDFI